MIQRSILVLGLVLLALPGRSFAAVITFEPGAGTIIENNGAFIQKYVEAGMVLETEGAGFFLGFGGDNDASQFSGDSSPVRFSTGGKFDLHSLTVGIASTAEPFINARFMSSSGAVLEAGLGDVIFPSVGWSNIDFFVWIVPEGQPPFGPGNSFFRSNSIDNVEFSAVPEPGALILLAAGIAAATRRLFQGGRWV